VRALAKLTGQPGDLADRLAVMPDAAALVRGAADAADALRRLREAALLVGAMRLLAHALPPREAVWWACMCADHTAPADLPEADRAARAAAEQWVRRPADPARRTAMACAQTAGLVSPEAWAAVGAFWSGGSMAPEGQPVVEPAPDLCGTAIAGAVLLASVRGEPARQAGRLERFLASAEDIADGGPGRLTDPDV
jgi:hypothetical protein